MEHLATPKGFTIRLYMLRPLLTICVLSKPSELAAQSRLIQNLETQIQWIRDSVPGYGGHDKGLPRISAVQVIPRCSAEKDEDKMAYCATRATGHFIVYLTPAIWPSQHYVETVVFAIFNAAPEICAITYDRCCRTSFKSYRVRVGEQTPRRVVAPEGIPDVLHIEKDLLFW